MAGSSGSIPLGIFAQRLSDRQWAWLVLAITVGIYLSGGAFLPGNDALPNVTLPAQLIENSSLSFSPSDTPSLFVWRQNVGGRWRSVHVANMDAQLGDSDRTARELLRSGELMAIPRYVVVPVAGASDSDAPSGRRRYVSTFGIGAGLTMLPVALVARLFLGHSLLLHPGLLLRVGHITAALLIAGSAALLLLIARQHLERARAMWVVAAYGLGSCVWSLSSQTLWQQTPNIFFLTLSAYFVQHMLLGRVALGLSDAGSSVSSSTGLVAGRRAAWGAGLSLGAAVLCRPTSAVVVVLVLALVTWQRRDLLWPLCLGGAPLAVLLAIYNVYYLGVPWGVGQTAAASSIARLKTGLADPWQTPLWYGAAGLLLSPGRGLLVYSPVFLLSFWGLRQVRAVFSAPTRTPTTLFFALAAAVVCALWLPAFKWFDWWGGWSYGYRPLVDSLPWLAVLLIAGVQTLPTWHARRSVWITAWALLLWSVGAQFLGAFAYDLSGWNNRRGYVVQAPTGNADAVDSDPITYLRFHEPDARALADELGGSYRAVYLNIDEPAFRRRLWSLVDSPLVYYSANFGSARAIRLRGAAQLSR